MKLEDLATQIFEIAEAAGIEHMAVGAIAAGTYGIPRSTKDIDVLVATSSDQGVTQLMAALKNLAEFDPQMQFDTITWGRRWIGTATGEIPYKVELFEMFDDPFVVAEFSRRSRTYVPILQREIWVPSAEDVVIQKIRWARPKDLDDARDVLAVQEIDTLDLPYIEKWCAAHGTTARLHDLIASLPEF